MVFTKCYVFPILLGFWLPITVFITYTVSVLTEHVTPILPYISDTGTWAPESCIFGIMLTLFAMLMIIIIYIRYRQVSDIEEKNDFFGNIRKLNKGGLYVGFISVFGCLIVANFQVRLIITVHLLGAGICFGFGTVYQIIQVTISFKMYPVIGNKKINVFRVVATVISALSLITAFGCGLVSFGQFKGTDMTKWRREDGGYEFHFTSAVAEYVLAIATILHIVTFVEEFKSVEIHQPKIGHANISEQD